MAFFGYEFIYNGISSSNYGLVVSNIGESGMLESAQGSEIGLITKKILRNPVEYLLGVEQNPVLEFDIEFTAEQPLSAWDRNAIATWLFGRQKFEKLQIVQGDLEDVYFNCLFTNASVKYAGNLARGWKAHVRCDSPFAWNLNPGSISETLNGSVESALTKVIINYSANNYYTYPLVIFTTGNGNTVVIRNNTDNDLSGQIRQFQFTTLLNNETVTVDNGKQIMSSNKTSYLAPHFNYHWLRLVPGYNELQIYGYISQYSITYPVAKKVGG